ncbi:hypothetical protein PIB30_069584 [Stylosanthes scabra]|uniref:Uncharacterized protein n=1 Tax=Stylosanthes scabra TaxID=79078 RepID=A0ABU6TMY0_9FABA|nr:hypothetical protein [Stylosanthes scabra]
MEHSGSLAANESVCSFEVGIFEIVKNVSHDKQLGSKGKEEGANPIEMVSKSDMKKRRSTPIVKIGPSVAVYGESVETEETSRVLILVWAVVAEFHTNIYNRVVTILEEIAY